MTQSFSFPSSSSPKIYTTLINDNGLLSCDCPGWTVKKEGKVRECKHTKKVAQDQKLVLIERDGQQFILHNEDGVRVPAMPRATHTPIGEVEDLGGMPPGFIEPMLASAMHAGTVLSDYTPDIWGLEEKFDGHRIIMRVHMNPIVDAWSRAGNRRTLPEHILREALKLPPGVYDGELIVPGAKSYGVTAGQNSGTEQLMLFDVLELHGDRVTNETYEYRRECLSIATEHLDMEPDVMPISVSDRWTGPSWDGIVADIWNRGGEGAILKRLRATYTPGWRSPDWIKIKRVGSATVTIQGFVPGLNGPYSVTIVKDDQGNSLSVKTLNAAMRRAIAANPEEFRGKRLVISYHERTPSGSYRHPMWDHMAGIGEI